MNLFFHVLEAFLYILAFYLFYKKQELALIYIPVLVFAYVILEVRLIPSLAFYGTISILMFACIKRNVSFFKYNIFALCLVLYFTLLILKVDDLLTIRPFLFSIMWYFLAIPLIVALFKRYPRQVIFDELANGSLMILMLFVVNVLLSTVFGYSSRSMYGISSGVLYGNLSATDFNILAVASFVVLLKLLEKKNLIALLTYVAAFAFIMLSMRRSVMSITALGLVVLVLILIAQKKLKKVFAYGALAFLVSVVVVFNTNFLDEFNARYELRKLDERELEEEKRFIEYELLYNDMFVHGEYSPWLGFGLFDSKGNYGRGVFEERSLHGDLTSIAHSSGIIGVLFYLLMALAAFVTAFRASSSKTDKLIILFCAAAFAMYTVTGRYTEVGCMILLFLVLSLPVAKEEHYFEEIEEEEEYAINA
jgi:hypothetical protein